jgi:inhibitor of cysteine peptidase
MIQINEESNGTRMDLPIGETLELCLPENRTTGYKWVLESSSDVCVLLNNSFQPGHATGEPGKRCWQFRAERAGSGAIELTYRRTWSEEKAASRAFRLALEVC